MRFLRQNENVRQYKTTVPSHLQDAHYKGSKNLGHGIGYKYAHDYPNHYVEQQYLPGENQKTPGSTNPAILAMKNRSKSNLQKLREQVGYKISWLWEAQVSGNGFSF